MMGLEETISYIENSVMADSLQFFVTTTFGKIAVEVPDEFDPMHPIEVYTWKETPQTKWCMKHKNANADLYVSLGVNDRERKTFVHLKAIEIVHRCFFLRCLGIDIGEDVADAAVVAYLKNIERRNITDNFIESEFCKIHFNPIMRNDSMVRNMVRDMIQRRTEAARKVLKYGDALIKMNTNCVSFVTTYNRDIFSIVCYVLGDVEDPRIIDFTGYRNICQKAVEYLAGY